MTGFAVPSEMDDMLLTSYGFASSSNQQQLVDRQNSSDSQGSLVMCERLQEQDRQYENFADFMESNVDISQYIQAVGDPEWAEEEDLLNESDPKREMNFFHQQEALYRMYEPAETRQNDSASEHSSIYQPNDCQMTSVKRELEDPAEETDGQSEQYSESVASSTPAPSIPTSRSGRVRKLTKPKPDPEQLLQQFVPRTNARKYKRKSEGEKESVEYKLKRERNNDAVRRSRKKAAEAQRKRDAEVDKLKAENAALRDELNRHKAACRCGGRR